MEELARASGFSVAELFGGRGGKRREVAPKYRNPRIHRRHGLVVAVVPLGS